MKKPLSVLLILVLLLSLAPLTLASEEAAGESAEAPAEEPIGDVPETEPVPAPDGAETFDAWLEDGLLNWKSYTGATIYVVHYRLPTGQNARFELTDADKPFDFAAGLDKFDHPSGTYDIYLRAGYRRSNGEFIGLANSDHLYIDYTGAFLTLPKPEAWWDGTTIRWRAPDLTPYAAAGATEDNVCADIRLYEDAKPLTGNSADGLGVPISLQGTSWDASEYIDMPDRSYHFLMVFRPKTGSGVQVTTGETFTGETVSGRDLMSGYGPLAIDSAALTLSAPAYGDYPVADAIPAFGSCFTVESQYWCTGGETSSVMTGTFAYGHTYYYYALLKPDKGLWFIENIDPEDVTVRIGSKTLNPVVVKRLTGIREGWVQLMVPWKLDYPDDALIFEGGSLPAPGEALDATLPTCNLGRVTGLVWRVNGKEATGTARTDTTYTAAILVDKYFDDGVPSAVWNGLEASNSVRVNGRGRVFEFDFTTPTAHIGDATGDDEEDGYDAAVILQYCVGLAKIEPENMGRADADGVYGVTPADAAWVLKYKT